MFRTIGPVQIDFVTQKSIKQAKESIVSTILSQGGNLKVEGSRYITAGFGSGVKLRLFGIALSGVECIPRNVIVKLTEINNETEISITIHITARISSQLGYYEKLQQLMYRQALEIKLQFPDA